MDQFVLSQVFPVGGYLSGYKIIPIFIFCLLWWRLLTWMDKDAEVARLPREYVNLGSAGIFILAFVLLLLLPVFWMAFSVFVLLLLLSIGGYLIARQQTVGIKDLIEGIKTMDLLRGGARKPKSQEVAGQVTLMTKDGRALAVPEAESPERPPYDVLQAMTTEPLRRGMERLEFTPVEAGMISQYWVDGVAYAGAQFARPVSQAAISVLKRLAGLDLNEKRKPQSGMMTASLDGKKSEIKVTTAGSTAGESARLLVNPLHRHDFKLEQIGLSESQLKTVEELVREPGGIVLVSMPKGQGLTATMYAIIRRHDAFLSHIQSIERNPVDDLEGITQAALAKGGNPNEELEQVKWVISQEPDTILIPEVQNPKSARELIAFSGKGRRVYIGLHANTAIDAIAEWRQMIGDDDLATRELKCVIAGRLVRKVCSACKQPYQPDPETLRKLNLDHGRAQQFFQARTTPLVDQKGNPIVCTFCAEMRYRGRTGVFEVMPVNEEVRQAIMANSSPNQLRALFRKMRGRFIQEQALALVEKGETSIQEVLRALRGQEHDTHGGGAAGASGTFGATDPGQPPQGERGARQGQR